jgi:signal transduction histidine kinase
MKKRHSFFYYIVIFILAQLAWIALLGLWIYWYVYNYIVFEKVGDQISPQLVYDVTNVVPFVIGLVLLSGLSFMTSLIFRHLNVQIRLTKLYDNFIGNVTHELKSPLSSIQLYLETLKSREVPHEKQLEFIEMMIRDTSRLEKLINSILRLLALEKKKLAHDYQVYEAGSTVTQLVLEAKELFRLPSDAITIDSNADCAFAVDRETFKIVFDNLLDNSIKYSINSVQISVKVWCSSQKVHIEFKDNGIGITSKELKKVFNKFHRIYSKDIPNVKGTGLGLYLVKEIIKSHGGKIYVTSEGTGKGSVFIIDLPVYQPDKNRFANKLLKKSKRKKAQVIK